MISLRKFNISALFKFTNKSNFSSINTHLGINKVLTNNTFSFQKRMFCNLARLNFEKLSVSKPQNSKNAEGQEFRLIKDEEDLKQREAEKAFVLEENIIEFGPSLNWEEVVMKSEIPVLVDCYADWCGPCKKLDPILTNKLKENKNFKLIKINIDLNNELADMLNIKFVPTIFLIYKGNVMMTFNGFPDEKTQAELFDTINLLKGIANDENVIKSLLKGADEWMIKSQYERAENMLNEAASHSKWKKQYGYVIKLGTAICAFNKQEYDRADKLVKELKEFYGKELDADQIAMKKCALLEIKLLFRRNPELVLKNTTNFYKEIENNPKDLNWRYQLAVLQFENSEYDEAIKTLLEIIAIDRNWNNKAANALLKQIFSYLGSDNTLTIEGRKKLTKLLF